MNTKMSMKVSWTIDVQTSQVDRSYFAVPAHWISEDCRMKYQLLEYIQSAIPHDEESAKNVIENGLQH